MDNPDNLPGNSHYKKSDRDKKVSLEEAVNAEEVKTPEKIVTGEVKRRKKPRYKRWAELFFGGSTPRDIGGYILLDVLIPAARDTVVNAGREGLELLIYPDGRHVSSRHYDDRPRRSRGSRVRYDIVSAPGSRQRPRDISSRARSVHDFDEILIDSRVEAEEIIQQLYEYLERYEEVTVAQLYGLLGISPAYTDQKYGWLDLRGLRPIRTKDGYLLDLPKPEALD